MCLLQCQYCPDTNQQSRHLHRFHHFPEMFHVTQSIRSAQSLNQAAECVVCRRHLEVFFVFFCFFSPITLIIATMRAVGCVILKAHRKRCVLMECELTGVQAAGSVTAGAETQNLSWKRVLGSFSCPKWTELFSEAQFADCRASRRSGRSWSPLRSFFTGY